MDWRVRDREAGDAVRPAPDRDFNVVLPQIQYMLSHRDFITKPAERRALQDRLDTWWRAARGERIDSEVSIFRIAHKETLPLYHEDADVASLEPPDAKPLQPSVVVMPQELAEERGLPLVWRELRDAALPLVVARDLARIRNGLYAEFPHAHRAIDLVLRDLREGAPVRIQPTILLGPPASRACRHVHRRSRRASIRRGLQDTRQAVTAERSENSAGCS